MNTNPVRLLLSPVALLAFAAAAQAFIDGADTRGIITAVLGVLILASQELARKQVTPLADPKLDDGTQLVPAADRTPVAPIE